MRVAIIGPFPPPYGGISIHIKRMKRYLEDKNIECSVYNESQIENSESGVVRINSLGKFAFKIPFIKDDIIHFHLISKKMRLLIGVYAIFGKKVILTLHGDSLQKQLNDSNFITRAMLKWNVRHITNLICVNKGIEELLLQVGVDKKNIAVIPAYINPVEDESEANRIPVDVWSFMENAGFLIAANGFIRLADDNDLYGLDMLVDLMKTLKDKRIKAYLIFALLGKESQSPEESAYYNEIKNLIEKYNLGANICIHEVKDSELYPILKKSNLFIRPTFVDGYGVSIAEAIYYGIPAIASNVCIRPEGTILFESRSLEDLENKVLNVINNHGHYCNEIGKIKVKDFAEDVLNVYKACSGIL